MDDVALRFSIVSQLDEAAILPGVMLDKWIAGTNGCERFGDHGTSSADRGASLAAGTCMEVPVMPHRVISALRWQGRPWITAG